MVLNVKTIKYKIVLLFLIINILEEVYYLERKTIQLINEN